MNNLRNIYLLKGYNNYFNRIVKKHSTLDEYLENCSSYKCILNVNFNPNDGVDTELVLNTVDASQCSDYLLVVNFDEHNSSTDPYIIESKWFITGAIRNRGNQWKFTLHRDVIVENYDNIVSAPCYIEKATATKDNPLILNSEGMKFNQIKKEQTVMYDILNVPWIVGYISRDAYKTDGNVLNYSVYETSKYDTEITQSKFTELSSKTCYSTVSDTKVELKVRSSIENIWYGWSEWSNIIDNNGDQTLTTPFFSRSDLYSTTITSAGTYKTLFKSTIKPVYSSIVNSLKALTPNTPSTSADINEMLALDDLTVKVGSAIYTAKVTKEEVVSTQNLSTASGVGSTIWGYKTYYIIGTPTSSEFNTQLTQTKYTITFEQQVTSATITVPRADSRLHLVDSPYDMFCMPYTNREIYSNGTVNKQSKNLSVTTAIEIARQSGTGTVYDVQILPYCPIREAIITHPQGQGYLLDLTNTSNTEIKSGSNTIGYVLWCRKSEFSFPLINESNRDYVRDIRDLSDMDYKVENETSFYRINSPNYSSYYEINLAKNGGIFNNWKVDCNYKPIAPYIHIAPEFNGLYGTRFDDARGLILSGDFSLPQVSSAWEDYERSNSNYQKIFDRQMQSLDIQQDYQRTNQIVSSLTGATASGIGAGIFTSNAAIGGATSAASILGGVADYAMSEKLRQEEKSYKTDMYNLNLQNIQAIPNTLTKVSALNVNNLLAPILEYYTCTDREKETLKNKLRYNGMTINALATIGEYLKSDKTYIKGQLVRLEGIEDDPITLNAIFNEINKGVFI